MSESLTTAGAPYSALAGFVFVFNLLVGTGALTMPHAFQAAGWLLSGCGVCVLAAMGYLTVTFLIESMGVANALLKREEREVKKTAKIKRRAREEQTFLLSYEGYDQTMNYSASSLNGSTLNHSHTEADKDAVIKYGVETGVPYRHSATSTSHISQRVELGQMASMFYPRKFMVVGFYVVMCIYLYGDLAIYSVTVTKSLRNVICTYTNHNEANASESQKLLESDICWSAIPGLARINTYRILLVVFTLGFGPFIFFNVQKTKYLQYFTITSRFIAFSTMIVLVSIRLSRGYGHGHPSVADVAGLPTLFGVCVYSFMSHHSLPSLVTPIRDKSHLNTLLAADYLLILTLTSSLAITGLFAFNNLQDLYTLNFLHDHGPHPITKLPVIEYFLALFPVFTLSTNYPLLGVTLKNNLRTLGHLFRETYPCECVIFPLITIIPPFIISVIGTNVTFLVSFTGSYAGACIQYLIPALMVYYARNQFKEVFGTEAVNKHTSPFRHWFWLVLVLVWFVISVGFVTAHHVITLYIRHVTPHHHCAWGGISGTINSSTTDRTWSDYMTTQMYKSSTSQNIAVNLEPGPVIYGNTTL